MLLHSSASKTSVLNDTLERQTNEITCKPAEDHSEMLMRGKISGTLFLLEADLNTDRNLSM